MSRAGVAEHTAAAGVVEPERAAGMEQELHVRTRTKPEVKWLANELSAVKGELERIDEELTRLQARKERLLGVQRALSDVAGVLTVPELPAVVPAIRANERFGARGALRGFIRDTLQQAYPGAVDTLALVDAVAARFGVAFPNAQARNSFRKYTVVSTLKKLLNRGEVERLHDFHALPNSVGAWRWKVDAPSFKGKPFYAARLKLQEAGILQPSGDALVFTQDYVFKSPSSAAAIVVGNNMNGWVTWKNESGETLDQVIRQE